jgi:predicted transcriptional regulator
MRQKKNARESFAVTKQRGRSPKRSKVELYATVLEVIKRYPEGARITKLSYGVGAPIDRLKPILADLVSFGLVQTLELEDGEETTSGRGASLLYSLTPRAFEFLETYWKMRSFLEAFGRGAGDDFL